MRKTRIKAEEGIGCYHVTSRIVDRSFKVIVLTNLDGHTSP